MTSATEKLRKLLDERGVEWAANDGEQVKETCWPYMGELVAAFAEYDNGTTRFACDTWCFTPEQAIAATLGIGTLTAEDVRSFLNRNSVFDDTTWTHGRQELVFDEDDLQAMADELNATLGRGAERDARCLGCKYRLDGMCMLPVGDDYRHEFVNDDYFCASWEVSTDD